MYTKNSIVAIRPFTRQWDGEEVVIGRVETGVFLAVPPDAVTLLDQLAAGKTVGEVAEEHQQKTGEVPDVADFLELLEAKGLIEPENTQLVGEKLDAKISEPRYHFSGFPQRLAQFVFSPPVFFFEALLTSLAIGLVIRNHSLLPGPLDLVFAQDRVFGLIALMAITYASVFLHEMSHLIAARAVGVNSRMGISHRLWYLVAETDLTGLWSVSRNQRYLPMLAGMIFDAVFTALLIIFLFAAEQHIISISPWFEHLIRATAFANLMRILWEFFLFTRTDVYFVAANYLNCKNLLNDTNVFLRNQLAKFRRGSKLLDQSALPLRERQAVRTYALLYLAGRAWAFASLFCVTLPFCVGYWGNLLIAFRTGYSANPSNFIDALVASTFFLVPTGAGFVLWGRTLLSQKGV